jgi:hypothetical protein
MQTVGNLCRARGPELRIEPINHLVRRLNGPCTATGQQCHGDAHDRLSGAVAQHVCAGRNPADLRCQARQINACPASGAAMADRNVDVTLRYCSEVSAADWIVQAQIPWEQLVNFGPPDFPAYTRLRFIPDPTEPGQTEADAYVAPDHLPEMEQTRLALEHLRRFTATPADCYFCVWEGYPVSFPRSVLDGPMMTIPHRRYFLLHGSLTDLVSGEETLADVGDFPPAFAWPGDHRWCFARDVDPHWAGIGAELAAIDTLLNAPELDFVRARPSEPQPTYY